eukprot:GEMP01130719.1.p1 GENE.GEMP01130719.1~~GEMP01130719.1.p1  ORF type:complete len:103 (+),score=12.72 GEMP01130719.1:175-483(+)
MAHEKFPTLPPHRDAESFLDKWPFCDVVRIQPFHYASATSHEPRTASHFHNRLTRSVATRHQQPATSYLPITDSDIPLRISYQPRASDRQPFPQPTDKERGN